MVDTAYENYAIDWIDSAVKRLRLIDALLAFGGKLIDSYQFKSYTKPTYQVLISIPAGKKDEFESAAKLTLYKQMITGI